MHICVLVGTVYYQCVGFRGRAQGRVPIRQGWGGGWGVFFCFAPPFWDTQLDIRGGGPFCTFVDFKNAQFYIKKDFGEIDFTNDRLTLKKQR